MVPQSAEVAARSYDVELKALARRGTMTDSEIEFQIKRLADKKRPLDEIRDFSFAHQALKELASGKSAQVRGRVGVARLSDSGRERRLRRKPKPRNISPVTDQPAANLNSGFTSMFSWVITSNQAKAAPPRNNAAKNSMIERTTGFMKRFFDPANVAVPVASSAHAEAI
jgi:hypothetical protein